MGTIQAIALQINDVAYSLSEGTFNATDEERHSGVSPGSIKILKRSVL